MENPLITIIIPLYNVDKYISHCLDSIISQTYQSLQIILVDDGSSDRSGEICDRYASEDPRIQVIHQENCGVAAARNRGLAAANGEWVGWVDSDDWIEPDMFEYLLKNALYSGADIAVCSRYEEYREKQVFRGWEESQILDTEHALLALLENDKMQNFLWDKLWRRTLFDSVFFPEGKTYEDIAIMHRLFEKAETVICLPEAKYHYFQRPGSIVGDVSLGNRINHYIAARKRCDEMEERWPQFHHLLEAQCVASAVGIWCCYYLNPKQIRQKYLSALREISSYGAEHYQQAVEYMTLGITGRCVLHLIPYVTWWSFAVSRILGKLYQIKHGREL